MPKVRPFLNQLKSEGDSITFTHNGVKIEFLVDYGSIQVILRSPLKGSHEDEGGICLAGGESEAVDMIFTQLNACVDSGYCDVDYDIKELNVCKHCGK